MKKVLVSILAFLYLGVSSGIAMEIHYCMGEKAGIEFYGSGNDQCGKCGMKEKKGGCCKDEHKFYKISDAHKNIANNLGFEMPAVVVTEMQQPLTPVFFYSIAHTSFSNHSPPLNTGPSPSILFCIFRL